MDNTNSINESLEKPRRIRLNQVKIEEIYRNVAQWLIEGLSYGDIARRLQKPIRYVHRLRQRPKFKEYFEQYKNEFQKEGKLTIEGIKKKYLYVLEQALIDASRVFQDPYRRIPEEIKERTRRDIMEFFNIKKVPISESQTKELSAKEEIPPEIAKHLANIFKK